MANVITTAITRPIEYSGNLEKARKALKLNGYIPDMLNKRQLNSRLHKTSKGIPKFHL